MTREECAEALYDLIVTRGRWRGKRPVSEAVFGNGWDGLPDYMRELWYEKAEQFAVENRFTLL